MSHSSNPRQHRAQVITIRHGVTWAVRPDAVDAATGLRALPEVDGRLLVLCGGGEAVDPDRTDQWLAWATKVHERASHVLLFGPASDRLAQALRNAGTAARLVHCVNIADAALAAARLAVDGDTVLFAPACPSDRGTDPDPIHRFCHLVRSDAIHRPPEAA